MAMNAYTNSFDVDRIYSVLQEWSNKVKPTWLKHILSSNHGTWFILENNNLHVVLFLLTQPSHPTILSKLFSPVAEESGTEGCWPKRRPNGRGNDKNLVVILRLVSVYEENMFSQDLDIVALCR